MKVVAGMDIGKASLDGSVSAGPGRRFYYILRMRGAESICGQGVVCGVGRVQIYYNFITIPMGGRAMSEQRTESQEQGPATLSREQIELIGVVLEPRFEKVVSEMRLAIKEEVEKVRGEMDTAIKDTRAEMKDEVRDQIQAQSKHFYWVIGGLVAIWLAAATLAVNKWPQATPVAPTAPVAQVAPVTPAKPADLNEPPDLSQP